MENLYVKLMALNDIHVPFLFSFSGFYSILGFTMITITTYHLPTKIMGGSY